MNVKKIFMILISIVMCVLIGAFAINILLPNVATTIVNATEDSVFKATGMSFDFNNDGKTGSVNSTYEGDQDGSDSTGTDVVDGFE